MSMTLFLHPTCEGPSTCRRWFDPPSGGGAPPRHPGRGRSGAVAGGGCHRCQLHGILELSGTVPVIVEFYAGAGHIAEAVIAQFGALMLATVDAQANPQLQQAFKVAAVPTVAAVMGGRPVPLFQGELPEAEVRRGAEQLSRSPRRTG